MNLEFLETALLLFDVIKSAILNQGLCRAPLDHIVEAYAIDKNTIGVIHVINELIRIRSLFIRHDIQPIVITGKHVTDGRPEFCEKEILSIRVAIRKAIEIFFFILIGNSDRVMVLSYLSYQIAV